MKVTNLLTIFFAVLTIISGVVWLIFDKSGLEPVTVILGTLTGLVAAIGIERAIWRVLLALIAIAVFIVGLAHAYPGILMEGIIFPVWLVLITSVLLTAGFGYWWWRQSKVLTQALELNALDNKLWRLLTELDDEPDRTEISLKKIADDFLSDLLRITKRFSEGFRVSVFRPDKDAPDYLCIWSSANMPVETVERTRFLISKDPDSTEQIGVAARAYLQAKMRQVRFYRHNGHWIADDLDHKIIVRDREPSYRSYIAVPIKDDSDYVWGVLCLDSKYANAFSSPQVQDLLISIANRFAAIMLFAHSLLDRGKP